jgi:hypothetical protein
MLNCQRKHRNKVDYSVDYYYSNFKKLNPEIKLNQLTHTKIIKTFFRIVVYKMINEMFKFHFIGIGDFFITKEDPKIVERKDGTTNCLYPVNWPETKKIRTLTGDFKRKVHYLNDHTRGKIYRFRWDNATIKFTNRSFYSFIPARSAKHTLSTTITNSVKPLNAYIL